MKVLVLYRPESEHASAVESFLRDLERRHVLASEQLNILNLDSREGAEAAKLYDVVEYPAILAVDDFGSIIRSWQGEHLPLLDDIAGYTH